jgi:ornithine lipid hydroxylase
MIRAKRIVVGLFQWSFYPSVLIFTVWFMSRSLDGLMPPPLATVLLFFGNLAVLTALERWMPFDARWSKADQSDTKVDAISLGVLFLVLGPISTLTPLLVAQLFLALGKPHDFSLFPAALPFWGQFALLFVIAEFGHYAAHHSARRVYSLNGYRVHPVNVLWAHYATALPLYLLGANPRALALYVIVAGISGSLQHMNVKVKFGFLNYIFSTPEVHRWHHSTRPEVANKNYGAILMIWDHIFGTYYFKKDAMPARVGLFDQDSSYPLNSYLRQTFAPLFWKKWVRMEDNRSLR